MRDMSYLNLKLSLVQISESFRPSPDTEIKYSHPFVNREYIEKKAKDE
jgi:hypothetical protein